MARHLAIPYISTNLESHPGEYWLEIKIQIKYQSWFLSIYFNCLCLSSYNSSSLNWFWLIYCIGSVYSGSYSFSKVFTTGLGTFLLYSRALVLGSYFFYYFLTMKVFVVFWTLFVLIALTWLANYCIFSCFFFFSSHSSPPMLAPSPPNLTHYFYDFLVTDYLRPFMADE